jgi:uncharacterized membrane protein YfcA
VSCALLGSFGLYAYIVPVVLLIVGLHYIPIGLLYHTKIQTVVALPVVFVAVLGILSLLTNVGADYAPGVCAFVGAVSTSILGAWAVKTIRGKSHG